MLINSELKLYLYLAFGVATVIYLMLVLFGFFNRSNKTLHLAFVAACFMALVAITIFALDASLCNKAWYTSIYLCYISIIAIMVPVIIYQALEFKRR